jgi:hypothetical protein
MYSARATGEGTDQLFHIVAVLGSRFNDVPAGRSIYGNTGDDVVDGRLFAAANFHPGLGDDTVYGSTQRDYIFDEGGNDTFYTNGAVNTNGFGDLIITGSGDDIVRGSADPETIGAGWGGGADDIITYRGDDIIVVTDKDADDRVDAGRGQDICQADPGDTLLNCP